MIRRCGDAGLREPEFTDSGGFKTTIWRAKLPEQIKVQPELHRGDLELRVINLLVDGPMSRSELSQKIRTEEALRSTLQRYPISFG